QNFERDEREIPPGAANYRMIPKLWQEGGAQLEAIGRQAESMGARETALEAYAKAVEAYRMAQHPIYYDDHPRKVELHGKLCEVYDRLIACAPYPIERVEVPFEGKSISCLLHLLPDRRKAPCVLYVPGMDQTKEVFPNVVKNVCLERGLHCLSMDGPGQGMSNMRKIRAVGDNYERAGQAVISALRERPEVDPDRIGIYGISMGSYWSMRIAARDQRVAAVGSAVACWYPNNTIFTQSSPRFKQMFMYMAGAREEAEFDRIAEKMTLDGQAEKVSCPVLLVTGEFDPLCPLEDAFRVFEEVRGPRELWVFENQFHPLWTIKNLGGLDCHPFVMDWLKKVLTEGAPKGLKRIAYARVRGKGPFDPACEWKPPIGPEHPYF
ncbi:MAG: alpha/beta hydrolase family protein, partial [Nitrospinota bacterium]